MKESEILKQVTDYLTTRGIYFLRLNSGKIIIGSSGRSRAIQLCPHGTPDLFILINGQAIFIEFKKSEKEIKSWLKKVESFKKFPMITAYVQREVQQEKEMQRIAEAGGKTYLVCSLEEVINIINQYGKNDK